MSQSYSDSSLEAFCCSHRETHTGRGDPLPPLRYDEDVVFPCAHRVVRITLFARQCVRIAKACIVESLRSQREALSNYHVVAERDLLILDPATPEDIVRLGEVCGLKPGMRILDMGSGKGEPAFILAERFGVDVVGVDHMKDFFEQAQARAKLLKLQDRCRFMLAEGEAFEIERGVYDVAMALGTTFIYGGFKKTLQSLSRGVKRRGFLVVGEPYWKKKPVPRGYIETEGIRESDHGWDWENAETIRSVGGELVHVFHADSRSWDHYETSHWRAVEEWAYENPKHPRREKFLEEMRKSRDSYLRWGREYLGWAIYVSRVS